MSDAFPDTIGTLRDVTGTKTVGYAPIYNGTGFDVGGTQKLADAQLSSNVPLKNAANVFTQPLTVSGTVSSTGLDVQKLNLGLAITDGVIVENVTDATAGASVQVSPRIRRKGSAYRSGTSVAESHEWFDYVIPANASGSTTSTLKIGVSIAGGTATYPVSIGSDGTIANGIVTVTTTTDPANTSVNALFLSPTVSSTRLYFGVSGKQWYSLNLSNVISLESVPGFSSSGTIQANAFGIQGATFIQRSGTTLQFVSGGTWTSFDCQLPLKLGSVNTASTSGTAAGQIVYDASAGANAGHFWGWNGSSWVRLDN